MPPSSMQAEGRWAALDESIFARGCSPRLPQLAVTPSLRERLGASLLSQREPGGVLSGKVLASLSAALMVSDEQKLHLGSQDQLEPRTVVKAPSSLPSPPCPLPVSEDVWSMLDATTPQHWKWIFTDFSSVIFF